MIEKIDAKVLQYKHLVCEKGAMEGRITAFIIVV